MSFKNFIDMDQIKSKQFTPVARARHSILLIILFCSMLPFGVSAQRRVLLSEMPQETRERILKDHALEVFSDERYRILIREVWDLGDEEPTYIDSIVGIKIKECVIDSTYGYYPARHPELYGKGYEVSITAEKSPSDVITVAIMLIADQTGSVVEMFSGMSGMGQFVYQPGGKYHIPRRAYYLDKKGRVSIKILDDKKATQAAHPKQ